MDKILTVSCKSHHTIETQRKKELEASHPPRTQRVNSNFHRE